MNVRPRAELALAWAHRYGLSVTVTSGLRTWAEQTKLRQAWESGRSQWPANKPGDSAHNYGLAWDSWVPEPEWWTWTYLRRAAGFHVPDHDRIHAEVPDWRRYVPALGIRRG